VKGEFKLGEEKRRGDPISWRDFLLLGRHFLTEKGTHLRRKPTMGKKRAEEKKKNNKCPKVS